MAIGEASRKVERNWKIMGGIIVAGGALALAACGRSSGKKIEAPVSTTVAAVQPSGSSAAPRTSPVTLTFDYLGANSTIIEVYPGVGSTSADKQFNGTYNNGDTVPAECKTEGRTVHSVPPETPRQSSEWIRIQGTPGETQYATAVYVQNPAQLLSQLPNC
jgi:hypothetical protein